MRYYERGSFGNWNGLGLSVISFPAEYKYPGSVLEVDQQNVYQSPYPSDFDIKPTPYVSRYIVFSNPHSK